MSTWRDKGGHSKTGVASGPRQPISTLHKAAAVPRVACGGAASRLCLHTDRSLPATLCTIASSCIPVTLFCSLVLAMPESLVKGAEYGGREIVGRCDFVSQKLIAYVKADLAIMVHRACYSTALSPVG